MALSVGQDTGYKAPIGLGPKKKTRLDELLMPDWKMPAFPAGGSIPQQNIFRPPGQAQAAIGMPNMGPGEYGKPQQPSTTLWGSGQPDPSGKPNWNIYGQDPTKPIGAGAGSNPATWGKPNYNIFGAPPDKRISFTDQGSGQAGPITGQMAKPGAVTPGQWAEGPDLGFTDPVTGDFVPSGFGTGEMWGFDPVTGEYMTADVLPFTYEQLHDPEFMRNYTLGRENSISPTENMQNQFPMLTPEYMEQLYTDWLADQKPEEMTETPSQYGPPQQPQQNYYYDAPSYPYIPSSWSSAKSGGGGGYQNFFKALYWRVGE
jgi:hypothetical protein